LSSQRQGLPLVDKQDIQPRVQPLDPGVPLLFRIPAGIQGDGQAPLFRLAEKGRAAGSQPS
jgi:hypothetical protein